MGNAIYAIAIGSNRPGKAGRPRAIVAAATAKLGEVVARSAIRTSLPLGPSKRRYANAVALVRSDEHPDALLVRLKAIERDFGRRPGRRWGARVLDLDIVLWSRGAWASAGLVVPHREFRTRGFVLEPLAGIAPEWRDPVSGRTVRHLRARLVRARPVDRTRPRA